MVQRSAGQKSERVAGEFAPFGQQVVSAGELARNAERSHRSLDDRQLPRQIVLRARDDEAEVEVAQIVIDRAAARRAPRERAAVQAHLLRRAFAPCVLRPPDHDRVRVLPQIQRRAFQLPALAGQQKRLLARQVPVRVRIAPD